MTSERLTVILFIISIILIVIELLWLYIISQNQEEYLNKRHRDITMLQNQIEAILGSPLPETRQKEQEEFLKIARKNSDTFIAGVCAYLNEEKSKDKLSPERQKVLEDLLTEFDPIPRLIREMKHGNKYQKAMICRLLGDLNATEALDEVRKNMKSKNHMLKYAAGMTLSKLGDQEGTIEFLKTCEKDEKYSHRVILELLQYYGGDKVELVRQYFQDKHNSDEYMRATIVKAMKKEELVKMKDILIDGFLGTGNQMRVACVKAMSTVGTPDLEQYLITASKDRDWILRLSAISGMEKINTPNTLKAVCQCVKDEQWWVRRRAAETLLRMDHSMQYVEEIINGYDRYAAGALKECMYKNI